jgi:hypothetical protein
METAAAAASLEGGPWFSARRYGVLVRIRPRSVSTVAWFKRTASAAPDWLAPPDRGQPAARNSFGPHRACQFHEVLPPTINSRTVPPPKTTMRGEREERPEAYSPGFLGVCFRS